MTRQQAENIERQVINNIKFLAHESGSIGEVEQKAGVSPGYLSRVIDGKKGIGFRTVLMLADTVGVDLADIMSSDIMKQKRIAALKRELAELEGSDKDAV